MFTAREINFATDKYEPLYHSPYILKKIIDFKSTDFNLVLIDAVTALSGMGAAVFLSMASGGFLSWLAFGAAFYFGKDGISGRDEHRKKFLEKLTELQAIYKWCMQTGGKDVTDDGTFLELLDVIFPFTRDKEKLLLAQPDQKYSDLFKKILSQPPHNILFREEKKAEFSFPSMSASWFFQSAPVITPIPLKKEPQAQLGWFADFRLYRYGEEKPQEKKPEEGKHLDAGEVLKALQQFRR